MKILLFCLLLIGSTSLYAQKSYTIGLPAFWEEEKTYAQWHPLVEYLSRSTDKKFEIKVFKLDHLEDAVKNKKIDFIFANPSIYVYYTYKYGLSSPLATVVSRLESEGVKEFAGVVFTRYDNDELLELSDLMGKNIAAVSPNSLAAYQMQKFELLQLGITLPDDAQVLFTGLPLPNVVSAVLKGRADAGFMRAGVLERMEKEGLVDPQSLKILGAINYPNYPVKASTRLYPEWPFAALAHTPDELSRKVSNALLSLPWEGVVAQNLDIVGFTIPGDYRVIDQLLRELRLPPFDDEEELTLYEFWQQWQYVIVGIITLFSLFLLVLLIALKKSYTKLLFSQKKLHRLAYYDELTGVLNRVSLFERLKMKEQQFEKYIFVLINVDRFKNINNARGSEFCDRLLHLIAKRLQDFVDDGTLLYRVGADEFAMIGRADDLSSNNLTKLCNQSFDFEGEKLYLSFSIAITHFPLSKSDCAQAVLKRATIALSEAKQAGGAQLVTYKEVMGESALHSFEIERQLPQAIKEDQLQIYLQPQFDADGKKVSAEVLLRWDHLQKKVLSPMQFIPIAERTNLIVDMGAWVLQKSFELIKEVEKKGTTLPLSINISAKHFRQYNFVTQVQELLAKTEVDPKLITLEVTESLVIDNIEDIILKMDALMELGVKFSIDDFGTGYSSLSYLKRLPVSEIKIDKSFVQGSSHNPDDAALVEMVITVAQKLNLQIVAEGVETQEQADFLNAKASLLHQGFLFGKPKPAKEWIKIWT